MHITPHKAILFLLLLSLSSASAQVVFSRRVYKETGTSYQEIWIWNPKNGDLKALTNSARDHYEPTCDGRRIKFISPDPALAGFNHAKLWKLNPATGKETVIGPMPEAKEETGSQMPGCEEYAKVGKIEACGNDQSLVVSRSGQAIGHFSLQENSCPKCELPIRSLHWTEDGKWLLIGREGLNDGSGSRQDDYYLLNLSTLKLRTVASAETAFWLPGRDQIVYLTPRNLAPLPDDRWKRNVWAQQLMFFDPVKGNPTAITSGISDTVDPSWCENSK